MAWLQVINTDLRNETLIIMSFAQHKEIQQDLMAENKPRTPPHSKIPSIVNSSHNN